MQKEGLSQGSKLYVYFMFLVAVSAVSTAMGYALLRPLDTSFLIYLALTIVTMRGQFHLEAWANRGLPRDTR